MRSVSLGLMAFLQLACVAGCQSSDDSGTATKSCFFPCRTPADCNPGGPAYDADNHLCIFGACIFQGCNSDAECAATNGGVCRIVGSIPVPYCHKPCSTPSSCVDMDNDYEDRDEDNWACTDGVCVYQGCNSDAECQASGGGVCRTAPGDTTPLCHTPCGIPADCARSDPLYDADNYKCTDGICIYQGCNSNAECESYNVQAVLCAPGLDVPIPMPGSGY